MTTVQNDATGEMFTFTDNQVIEMLNSAPDDLCRESARRFLTPGTVSTVDSDGFHFISYLAARCWLGVRPNMKDMQA